MAGNDTLLLVVARCVASKFEDLSRKVFEDSGEVHCENESEIKQNYKFEKCLPGAPAPTR